MKRYDEQKELQEVICNQCGKKLKVEKGILMEGILEVRQNFGYFSRKDCLTQEVDRCEECYDRLIDGCGIAVAQQEEYL